MSALYLVNFCVEVSTQPGEVVFIVGDCPQLGLWKHIKAVQLHKEIGKESCWSVSVKLDVDRTVKYRYFVGCVTETSHEDEDHDIIVIRWETNIRPRQFIPKVYCSSSEECVANSTAEFGFYNGQKNIGRGWLTSQSEVQLRLHGNPIHMWKKRHQLQTYRVKCLPLDLHHKESQLSLDPDDDSHDVHLPPSNASVRVKTISKTDCKVSEQSQFGEIYREDDYLVFKARTACPEFMGFTLEFYVHDPNAGPPDVPKYVGYAYVLPINMCDTLGHKTLPISGLKHKPIGQIRLEYLVVKPLPNNPCDMSVSFSKHWKFTRRPLDVGHRGMGSSYTAKKLASVRENTISSLEQAASHGADLVEFDVLLSKDLVPVIYHDFDVAITLRKKQKDGISLFKIAVKDLSLEQLHMLKVDHVVKIDSNDHNCPHGSEDVIDPKEVHFPTLVDVLDALDPHTGFAVEIKYAMQLQSGSYEQDHFYERNRYVDIILKSILEHAGERRIIIMSFDPDICVMCRLKQNKYPVLFLTIGDSTLWPKFMDIRAQGIERAMLFAQTEDLLGVNCHTEDLLEDLSMIQRIRDAGLVLFCYGEDNNDTANIKLLKDYGVNGVIYDRISEFKTNKENIFKLESDAKGRFMDAMGNLLTDSQSRNQSLTGLALAASDIMQDEGARSYPSSDINMKPRSSSDS